MEKLKGYKTYITGAVSIIAAIAGYFTGDVSVGEALQTVSTAFSAIFLRSGIANIPKK